MIWLIRYSALSIPGNELLHGSRMVASTCHAHAWVSAHGSLGPSNEWMATDPASAIPRDGKRLLWWLLPRSGIRGPDLSGSDSTRGMTS